MTDTDNDRLELVLDVVARFSESKVLCLGDVMIDRFIEGTARRISPECPVPVFNVFGQQVFPYGAANVARNIAALGGRCTLVGVTGDDAAASELTAAIGRSAGVSVALVVASDRPTTEKTRYVTDGHHMLRADVEVYRPLSVDLPKIARVH